MSDTQKRQDREKKILSILTEDNCTVGEALAIIRHIDWMIQQKENDFLHIVTAKEVIDAPRREYDRRHFEDQERYPSDPKEDQDNLLS